MADFTKYGDKTPRVVIYKSESQKLHQAFNVKTGENVKNGNPVVINSDGTISAFKAASKITTLIGIAVTDSINPAYKESRNAGPIEVTVAVNGYMVLNAVAKEVMDAGPIKPSGVMDSTGRFTQFEKVAPDSTEPVSFIALNPATEAGELIQVLVK